MATTLRAKWLMHERVHSTHPRSPPSWIRPPLAPRSLLRCVAVSSTAPRRIRTTQPVILRGCFIPSPPLSYHAAIIAVWFFYALLSVIQGESRLVHTDDCHLE